MPDRIKCLVYVAAYLPQNGQSLRELSTMDTASLVGRNFEYAADYSTAQIKPSEIAHIVCDDCSTEVKATLPGYLRPEPLAPLNDKVSLTRDRFGAVKKYYLFAIKDNSISYPFQKSMVKANGSVRKTFTMDTSHLPFVVNVDGFTHILLEIGKL